MIHSDTKKLPKKYECKKCCYSTNKKSSFQKHLQSKKHNDITKDAQKAQNDTPQSFECECGKKYTKKNNLYRHRKKCQIYLNNTCENLPETKETINTTPPVEQPTDDMTTMFMQLVKQNEELQNALLVQSQEMKEQNKTLIQLAQQPTTVINNTQNNYNILNFLNEQYKHAMTIDDFLESINVTLDDLDNVRTQGFVGGVGARIVKELKDLPESERPVHFSQRRIKEYFTKALEGWVKEDKDKEGLNRLVKGATELHLSKLIEWKKQHPTQELTEEEYEKYQNTMFNVYKGLYDDDNDTIKMKNQIFKQMEIFAIPTNETN